jgi:hypothetical protein
MVEGDFAQRAARLIFQFLVFMMVLRNGDVLFARGVEGFEIADFRRNTGRTLAENQPVQVDVRALGNGGQGLDGRLAVAGDVAVQLRLGDTDGVGQRLFAANQVGYF